MLDAFLCGGTPPGTKTTRARPRASPTCSAMMRCPWWMGSKVPPKMPTLMVPPSLEIELHRPDPHFVSGLGPGPPERSHDSFFLQRALEVLDPLGAVPVGPERHALHVLAGDLVGAVLNPLDTQPLPGGPEDSVLALAVRHGPLGHVQLPETPLEEIAQP